MAKDDPDINLFLDEFENIAVFRRHSGAVLMRTRAIAVREELGIDLTPRSPT